MKKYILTIIIIFSFIKGNAQSDTLMVKINNLEIQLQEIVINTKKKIFERKIDRLIFNVDNVMTSGGDATEAIRIIPGVQVANDQIKIIGKSGLSLMVDDKILPISGEDLINYLKTIPADNIKTIEVITTPPAKYDAQGNSGIINVILKKSKINSWNTNFRSSYIQSTYPSGNIGIDFNYKKNKLLTYSSFTYSEGSKLNTENSTVFYSMETWKTNAPRRVYNKFINGNFGLVYEFNDKWKIGSQYIGSFSRSNKITEQLTTILDNSNIIDRYIKSNGEFNLNPKTNSLNLFSSYKIDSLGKKITLDFDYFNYNNKNDINFNGDFLDRFSIIQPNTYFANKSNNNRNIENHSTRIDIEFPTNWISLNFGGKLSFSKTNNDFKFFDFNGSDFIQNNDQSNKFSFKENIQALYISGNKMFGKKAGIQLGLRFENTITEGFSYTLNQKNTNNYINLFPTLYLYYKLQEDKTLSFNYSRRINRPYFDALNPFKIYANPFLVVEGNPYLQPSFSNNFEIILSTKKNEHKLFYSLNKDMSEQFPFINESTNVVRFYPLNFMDSFSFGFVESYTFNKYNWWSSNNSAVIYYYETKSSITNTLSSLNLFSGNLSTNNDFSLRKNKTIVLNIGYNIELPSIQGYSKSTTFSNLYAGLRFLFLNKDLQIGITGNDILRTQRPISTLTSNGIKQEFRNYYDNQQFRISLNYKFGNKKIQSQQRDASNEDEKKRVGN